MIPKLLFVLLAAFGSFQVHAQSKSIITGQVKSPAGKPLKGATILLQTSPAALLVKTAVTNTDGNYEIELTKPGTYTITASFVSYEKISSAVFTVKEGENYNVPVIDMKVADKKLDAVTVKSTYQKPMIEVKADKTVFNVESSINATGSNAFELLQKSPGVITDKDDNITMKGKNGVRIYIDGRQTQFSTADLAAYLRSINSADIESIEMISNPSAKYDASGNAGIINIKFKKNKKVGLNGSFTNGLNIGLSPKTNQSLSLNYRNKKVNLFSNYSNSWGDRENKFFIKSERGDSLYDQTNKQISSGWTHNVKAGADFFIDKTSTIGIIATGNFNNTASNSSSRTPISAVNTGELGQILYASNTIPGQTKNLNLNLNYRYADTAGRELNIDADRSVYTSRKSSYQPNAYYLPYPEEFSYEKIYRNNTPTNINISTIKLDYEAPFKKGKLGFGAKYSNVKTDNTFDFYNVINGTDLMDYNRSNNFSYKENVNALYVNYNRTLNQKWTVQAGLRMENTGSEGILTRADGVSQADDIVKRNYTDIFPSAAVTYNASMSHIFNLTYSRRIDRPSYQDLNPFENKLDELTYQKGNAFLRPQYTNSFELTHTFKYRYNTTIGYSHIKDFRAQIIDTADKNRGYITQKNLASQDIVNINFSLPFQVKKWWTIYANINAYHSLYKANFGDGKIINIGVTSASFYMQQSFTLGDGYTGEVSGFYNAPSVWAGTFKSRAMGGMDVGIQKKLFKDKGSIKISYTDLLHTMRWWGNSDYGGSKIEAHGNWESQQLRLNFTYRFGNTQVKQARQRKTGSEEENKRTQSSGGFGGS